MSIESIWEDESLLEVRVEPSNGFISGRADCYTNRVKIKSLAQSIEGFPERIGQVVSFTTGESDDISFFSLKFKCIDGSGHVVVRVKVAHIDGCINAEKEDSVSEFDLKVEALTVDKFVRSLTSLSKSNIGEVKATLAGKK